MPFLAQSLLFQIFHGNFSKGPELTKGSREYGLKWLHPPGVIITQLKIRNKPTTQCVKRKMAVSNAAPCNIKNDDHGAAEWIGRPKECVQQRTGKRLRTPETANKMRRARNFSATAISKTPWTFEFTVEQLAMSSR
ncbi:predicted protein [Histoplasma mississippiense (nom. inval.)]|uniref:predicted protein n=1 Tax=Ajellomyces capsulatus (strain NAm1 / WU24) TaxID=2059318 RepID=UPI000157B43E|nr:predicted protein [Histoplasma mississippiense (nom. inval.)]EDN02535.1 predicted protein [Histoplasma mississippiense (nom. inval.)]